MSALPSRFQPLYRFAAFVALFAILLPTGIMLVHQPAAAQSMMRICMAGQTGKNDAGKITTKIPHCPICQSLNLLAGVVLPPHDSVIADISVIGFAPVVEVSGFLPSFVPVAQAQPRAPPSLV